MRYTFPQNDWRSYLEHSAKGQVWKNHKYIEIRNGRYIYPEDLNKVGYGGGTSKLHRPNLKTILQRKVSYEQSHYGGSGRKIGVSSAGSDSSKNSKRSEYISGWAERKRRKRAPIMKVIDRLTKRSIERGTLGGYGGGKSKLYRTDLKTILRRKSSYEQSHHGGSSRKF